MYLHCHLDWCVAGNLPIPEYSPLSAGSTHAVCTYVYTALRATLADSGGVCPY